MAQASASEIEGETEEILLFAEIDGLLCTEILEHDSICLPTFKLIGLDTNAPYMQIGNEIFEGEYQDRIGSALFFEKDPEPAQGDTTFRKVPENPLRYYGKTDKNLYMSRVFVKSKTKPENKDDAQPSVQPSYIDSDDMKMLAATEKEYLDMIETFQDKKVVSEILSDLNDSCSETEEQDGKEGGEKQSPVTEIRKKNTDMTEENTDDVSETSALMEVSQLISEQMSLDSNPQEPAT